MPNVHVGKTSFAGGEYAPSLTARVDIQKYSSGAKLLKNLIVHPHGGISNTPGQHYVAMAKYDNREIRLHDFQFSSTQNYVIEFGHYYARFYKNMGQILMSGASAWVTAHSYSVGDFVSNGGITYYCLADHTSGTFATDLSNGEWVAQAVYEIPTPYSESDLPLLNFTQSADVLFIFHPNYQTRELNRFGDTNWALTLYQFVYGPFMLPNSDLTSIVSISPVVSNSVTITATQSIFTADNVGGLFSINLPVQGHVVSYSSSSSGQSTSIPCGGTWRLMTHGTWTGKFNVEKSTDNGTTWTVIRTFTGSSDTNMNTYGQEDMSNNANPFFVRLNITSLTSGTINADLTSDPFYSKGVFTITGYTSGYVVSASINKYLYYSTVGPDVISGATMSSSRSYENGSQGLAKSIDNNISTWWSVPGSTTSGSDWIKAHLTAGKVVAQYTITAVPLSENGKTFPTSWMLSGSNDDSAYTVLDTQVGQTWDYNSVKTFTIPNTTSYAYYKLIILTGCASIAEWHLYEKVTGSPSASDWAEGAWSTRRGWPSVGEFFQDRLVTGNTPTQPQTSWFTKTSNYYDYSVNSPLVDSDAININLPTRQLNGINGFVPLKALIAMTSSSEWSIGTPGNPLTPTTASQNPNGFTGSSGIKPVIIKNRAIFVQAMGAMLNDLGYSLSDDSFTGADISVFAEHLFTGYTIKDMAYQQYPDSIVWAVRSDGAMLSMTYMREQEVLAWTWQYDDFGSYESIAVIPSNGYNQLWMSVKRGTKRYIEYLDKRMSSKLVKDQFFVRCGIVYDGAPASVITGLSHLEGMDVAVLADGNVLANYYEPMKVTGGQITLDSAYSKVIVGLPYLPECQTLNVEVPLPDGTAQGRKARISKVGLRLLNSRGGWIGSDKDHLTEISGNVREYYDTSIDLFTGDVSHTLGPGYQDGGSMFIRQVDPLPITILALIPIVTFGGSTG